MGVHCQMSTNISVGSAVAWPDNHGCGGIPTQPRSWLAKPMVGSKISRHIMPTATGVATSGSRIATRTHRSPRNGRQSSNAIPMPKTISAASAPMVKRKVRPTDGQNRTVSVSTLM